MGTRLICAAVTAAALLFTTTAFAGERRIRKPPVTYIEIDPSVILGTTVHPGGSLTSVRPPTRFVPVLTVRASFDERILQSADDL